MIGFDSLTFRLKFYRRVEKWLSRKVHILETAGSNPASATWECKYDYMYQKLQKFRTDYLSLTKLTFSVMVAHDSLKVLVKVRILKGQLPTWENDGQNLGLNCNSDPKYKTIGLAG